MAKQEKPLNHTALSGQQCPFCNKNTLSLIEQELEVPYFGKIFLFSMQCSSCKAHKSDVEAAEQKEPASFTLKIETKEDVNARVIKSSEARVEVKGIGSIEPGEASEGFVSNVEGVLMKLKTQIEHLMNAEEEESQKQKAERMMAKIDKIINCREIGEITISDRTGNSAIISPNAIKKKIK